MFQFNELGTVLLVDDHLPLLRNMAFLLEITGFTTLTASNGAEALQIMDACSPDLIISDVRMPIMDGYDFLKAVREDSRWQQTPFIFSSACYDLDDVLFGLDMGANDYLPKPFDIYDVLDSIQRTAPHIIARRQKLAS